MICSLVFCAVILGQPPSAAPSNRTVFSLYEKEKAATDRDADAQIRLALWCEQHGLNAERLKHLALAVARDPANTLARGLLGMVAYHGKWTRPEEVRQAAEKDADGKKRLSEYHERRARTPRRADAQLELAQWCQRNGLEEQAMAHYSAVVRLDPSRDLAWKKLGYQRSGNAWVKPKELAASKLEADLQKRADLHYKARLEKLRDGLESSSAARRDKARDGLAEIADPRAVPMVCEILASGGERLQLAAVGVLGQIEGPSASTALALATVFSESKSVRDAALSNLEKRDPRDVIGRLINLIRRPYKYTVRQGDGPGSSGELLVDGERFNLQRLYRYSTVDARTIPPSFEIELKRLRAFAPGVLRYWSLDQLQRPDFWPKAQVRIIDSPQFMSAIASVLAFQGSLMALGTAQNELILSEAMLENARRNQDLQQSLANDVELIEALNGEFNQLNDRVLPILKSLTGVELGADPEAWKKWWSDQQGYVYESSTQSDKPTYSDTISNPDISLTFVLPGVTAVIPTLNQHHACFSAGTPVHTADGTTPIESIQVGDLVLSQNTVTGSLEFRAVVATHKNPPTSTLRLMFAGEPVVATGIHRFWKLGKGWTMARDLKAGDQLRMVGGVVTLDSVESDQTQPVYNLDVADNRDFFVGNVGLLVHDFSFVQPVLKPFDRLSNEVAKDQRVLESR
jgi:hypothetical protein